MSEIATIERIFNAGRFNNYIKHITFPYYKNIKENSQLTFDFPFTVFVGKNGSGKSSVLRALYGAPEGKSLGDFWFSTAVDPIAETGEGNSRHCFFYSYTENYGQAEKEVLKQRARREGNPDYWETSAPVLRYGMVRGERNKPVKKDVLYLDFRGEISAFDKCFYFGKLNNEESRQDYLRRKSTGVNNLFQGRNHGLRGVYKGTVARPLITLNGEEISKINYILGKKYSTINILEHRLYNDWGKSIVVETCENLKYSEANAGSGESAIIQLVFQVLRAQEQSLILLDEPEVSLHPSAQKRLQLFLLEQVKLKKHQIVISTHSSKIIENLPNKAIKLFSHNSGKFEFQNITNFNEAFFDITDVIDSKKIIYCEDISAKILIEKILHSLKIKTFFDVKHFPGGAESLIKKCVPAFCENEDFNNIYFFLDGDKHRDFIELDQFNSIDISNIDFLKQKVEEVFGFEIPVYTDGNRQGGNIEQAKDLYIKYINFHKEKFYYLPKDKLPEDLILHSTYINENYLNIINDDALNCKDKLREIFIARGDTSIASTFEALTTEWLKEKNENFEILSATLEKIYNS